MARRRIYGVAAAAAAGAVLVATPSSATTAPELQAPETTKSGYDIQNYKLALGYDRPAKEVNATTTITATAESPTRTFALDFTRTPKAATVNGVPATITRDGDTTVITLDKTLPEGERVTIVLTYTVTPPSTADGAAFPELKVPDGATDADDVKLPEGWLPRNVRPDAATFDLASTLPANLKAAKSGHGMRYIEAIAAKHADKAPAADTADSSAPTAAEIAAKKAAVREAMAQRAAAWKAARAAAEDRHAAWKAESKKDRDEHRWGDRHRGAGAHDGRHDGDHRKRHGDAGARGGHHHNHRGGH
jgi:hypothetical protein